MVAAWSLDKRKALIFAAGLIALIAVVTAALWTVFARGEDVLHLAFSDSVEDRLKAAEELAGQDGVQARQAIRRLCRDSNGQVSLRAVRSLGQRPVAGNRDLLAELARDATLAPRVRGEAAAAYARFPDASPDMLAEMLTNEAEAEVREGAAKGLTRMAERQTSPQGVKALTPSLSLALEDGDARVRRWAIAAIHKMILRRFQYNPELPPQQQRQEIEAVRAYLRERGVL